MNSRYANCIKHASEAMRRNARPTQRSFWKTHFENGENCEATEIQVGSRGTIVNMASMSSFIAQPSFVPYNASKGAVLQMTRQDFLNHFKQLNYTNKVNIKDTENRCCALDFAEDNIRVNCVAPGTVDTPAVERLMRKRGSTQKEWEGEICPGNERLVC